jgi:hypothetical protein
VSRPDAWARVRAVRADGATLFTSVVRGRGLPDLDTVEKVARLKLAAVRLECRLVLEQPSPGLLELLELAGLRVEVEGQPEGREDLGGVQEEVEGRDPAV